ncbi:MAG: guanylate kinase [Candidatus Erginobacter occultus]|nr:guanylate kinase [Candidatus Erginobacter occultus]
MKGRLFILSAPSGAGKTTVCEALLEKTDRAKKAITTTTRPPRPGEKNGVDYFFLTEEEFKEKLAQGRFFEHALVYDYYYGSGRDYVESQLEAGYDMILVVDVQGARSIRELGVEAVFVYLLPPSLSELRRRLEGRKTDAPEVIEKRFTRARDELDRYRDYDYCVINDELETAVADLESVIRAERCRVKNYPRIVEKIIES